MAGKRAPDAIALTESAAIPVDWRPGDCPVTRTVAVIGGKWKPSLLYLLHRGPTRFNALQRALPGITQRMLTLQLRTLDRDGIVTRSIPPSVPPQVEDALSPLGASLAPVFDALIAWDESRRPPAPAMAASDQETRRTSAKPRNGSVFRREN